MAQQSYNLILSLDCLSLFTQLFWSFVIYATFCTWYRILRIALGLANSTSRCARYSKTIETVLNDADEPIIVHGAGRTDAGVHATNMIAHFDTNAIRPERGWIMGANSQLPKEIALQWIQPMGEDFHARFKACARRYRYVIYSAPRRPALLWGQVTHAHYALDVEKMQRAALKFEGTHNFETFRAAACQSNQPVRHVKHCRLFQHGAYLVLDIQAMDSYTIWCVISSAVY